MAARTGAGNLRIEIMLRRNDLTADEKYAAKLMYVAGPVLGKAWAKAWAERKDRSQKIRSFIVGLLRAEQKKRAA